MLTEDLFQKQKEVERLFASSAFIDAPYVLENCRWVKPELFIDGRIRDFWQLLLDGTDAVTASFQVGLEIEMLKWVNLNPSILYVKEYANILASKNYMAGISIQISKIAKSLGDNDLLTAKLLINDMAAHPMMGKDDIPGVALMGVEFMEAMLEQDNDIRTGIPKLDNNIGGLERHTVSIIAGRTSMGKTALALQIARNVAGPENKKVIFFSLEMKRKNLWARMACGNAGLSWQDKRAGNLTQDDEQRILQESDQLIKLLEEKLFVVDSACDTERIWKIVSQHKPDLIVVDHLRLVKDKQGESEVKRQGWIMERLHDLAKDQNCHVMVLAQLNREVDRRGDHLPVLADLRDSGEIEENADLVIMLYRPDVYDNNSKPQLISETHLLIRKFRDGIRNGRIKLDFDTRKQWFTSPDDPADYKNHTV